MCAQCESKNKLLQKHDKNKTRSLQNTYPKLMLNILQVVWDSTSIYIHGKPSKKKELKKLPYYMWAMFTHVHPCVAHVHPCRN